MFIRGSGCCRGFEGACIVGAGYLDSQLIMLEPLLSHESRRIGGGGTRIEVSLVRVLCFMNNLKPSEAA